MRRLCWLSLAVGWSWTVSAAWAVCLNKDGLSVNPSREGPTISWNDEFRRSTLILMGKVIAAKNVPDKNEPDFWSGTLYTLTVDAFLKGTAPSQVDVFSPNDSSRLLLAKGYRYLLFLRKQGGQWAADSCGNSAKLTTTFP